MVYQCKVWYISALSRIFVYQCMEWYICVGYHGISVYGVVYQCMVWYIDLCMVWCSSVGYDRGYDISVYGMVYQYMIRYGISVYGMVSSVYQNSLCFILLINMMVYLSYRWLDECGWMEHDGWVK